MNIKHLYSVSLITALSFLLVIMLVKLTPYKLLELAYEDILVTQPIAAETKSKEIVILEVTESTLARFPYRSPLDRGFLAEVLERLQLFQARAIGIDILFDQPTEPNKDERLRRVLEKSPGSIVVVKAGLSDGLSTRQLDFQNSFLDRLRGASAVLTKNNTDGVVRHLYSSQVVGDGPVFSLSRTMAGSLQDSELGNRERIFFQGDAGGLPVDFTVYPAEAISILPPKWFANKFVLIGMNLSDVDQFRTPFVTRFGEQAGLMPGIIIHAHALNQILLDVRLLEIPYFVTLLLTLAAGAVGAMWILTKFSVTLRAALSLVGGLTILVVPYLTFPETLTIFPAVTTTSSFFAALVFGALWRWQADRSQKFFIKSAWSKYVSPAVVGEILSDPRKLQIGGERRDISCVFTDIASFTSLTEDLPADRLSQLLNQYLDLVSAEFLKSGATLDKFVGDAVIGFFGAPIDAPDHPDKAVSLALKIDEVCQEFQTSLASQGLQLGNTRVGVHSGSAIVGNFGGKQFFDYTAIGDTVNIAARLEAANKTFGGNICVSGDTSRRALSHQFRAIGNLKLAGKTKLIEAWEPIVENSRKNAPVADYERAFEQLQSDPAASKLMFIRLRRDHPDDHLVLFHLNRLMSHQYGTLIETNK